MAIIFRSASNCLWTCTFSRNCKLLKPKVYAQRLVRFASLREPLSQQGPVQYSSSKASRVTIAQVLGFKALDGKKKSLIKRLVTAAVLSGVIIYLFFIRTDNELDELFNLDSETVKKSSELLDLKVKLRYCKNNNLPTDTLVARIEELEKNIPKPSPFRL